MAFYNPDAERLRRYFKGDSFKEDRDYLINVFCDKSNEGELEHLVRKQWYELVKENRPEDKSLDHILYRIHYELNTKQQEPQGKTVFKSIILWSKRIAATLFLPLLIYTGIQFFTDKGKSDLTWVEIKAPAWARVQFSLPDGSTGWLNSSSSVRYKNDFIKKREISLDGEAFFDVNSDSDRPFVVRTDEINVTAMGTRFNLSAYENEKEVEVVLEEGKLLFDYEDMTEPIALNPCDLVVYDKITSKIKNEIVQPHKYISWTEGKLVFRNDPIDVIARRLGRWYNVDVDINGDNFENVRLRATFIDENLEEVLFSLRRALPIDYKIIRGGFDTDDEVFARKKVIITMKK